MSSSIPATGLSSEIPSTSPTLGMKIALLWANNKPLFILIFALITLLILGIIFAVVYFLILKPHQDQSSSTNTAAKTAAHLAYQSLRSFAHA